MALAASFALLSTGCGAEDWKSPNEKLSERLTADLTKSGFTDITVESADVGIFYDDGQALVSVDNCRIRLDWRQGNGWKLHEGTVDTGPGELTADLIKKQPQFAGCVKQPTTSTTPVPPSQ
ncbi:MAG TPA: hypothetical protein VFH06_04780 [Candidatus Saccharimonadales bacterium]|nr:hypothetical protein [Candidatus Saccharimonadales bacterium]